MLFSSAMCSTKGTKFLREHYSCEPKSKHDNNLTVIHDKFVAHTKNWGRGRVLTMVLPAVGYYLVNLSPTCRLCEDEAPASRINTNQRQSVRACS